MQENCAFEAGEQYVVGGVGYHILKALSAGQILVKNLMTGEETAQNRKELGKQWNEGTLEFGRRGRNLRVVEGCPVKTSYEFTDLDFLKVEPHGEELIQETWDKYQLVCRLINIAPKERTDTKIEKEIKIYVTKQLLLMFSRKRTRPVFPSRSGKRQKEAPQEKIVEHFSPSELEEIVEGIEDKDLADLFLVSAPLLTSETLLLISARQVRRWIEEFELSGRDIRSLVPAYHKRGMRGVQLHTTVEELLQKAVVEVYMTEERPSVQKVIDKLAFLILQKNQLRLDDEPELGMPNKRKIYRYIDEQDPVEIDTARFGRRAAQRKHGQYGRGLIPTRPNERWEWDDTLGDLLVVDDEDGFPIGRPWFTAVRDEKTAVIPGFWFSFEHPSSHTALECLFYAIPEKDYVKELFGLRNDYVGYGLPETLAIDRGSAYLNKDVELACAQLHIELDPMPGRSPWLKGGIERYIKEAGVEVFHASLGTTFSSFLERGDYDPAKHACITLNGLWYIFHKWVVDVYTRKPHRGVGGVPAKLWERALGKDFVPRLPPSRYDLAILLSRIESRVIQNTGIEFENLWYQDTRLSKLRDILKGEPVYFKYNAGDISRIWVMVPGQKRYLEVLAADQDYTSGLSLWKHRVIKRFVREEMERDIDRVALIQAKEELYQLIHKEFRWGKKLGGRKRGARFLDIKVNEILRRAPSTDPYSTETAADAQFIDLDLPVVAAESTETEAVSIQAAQPASPEDAISIAAQLGVPLPSMVEGVTLLVNEERVKAGDNLVEPREARQEATTESKESGNPQGKPKEASEDKESGKPQGKPRVNTDPDEAPSFGISYSYGRRGPT
jgi:putative transposase